MRENTRPRGLTRDVGWEVGVRRTVPRSPNATWGLLIAPEGLRCWLGASSDLAIAPGAVYKLVDGTGGTFTVVEPGSHLRLTWQPPYWERPTTIQARVIPRDSRAVIAFHQERLPDEAAREARRAFFTMALDRLLQLSRADASPV